MTSSLLNKIAEFRETTQGYTISWRIRGPITSRLIMITDIITCCLCHYCPPKQGNDLRLLRSKDKRSHHEPACSVKLLPVSGIVNSWPPNQDNGFLSYQWQRRKNRWKIKYENIFWIHSVNYTLMWMEKWTILWLKGIPVETINVCWQQRLYLWQRS